MPDLPTILLIFAVALGLITVLGHGIWLMLAALSRAISDSDSKPTGHKCVYCNRLTTGEDRCQWCGKALNNLMAAELADLLVVERQLRRFRANGTMKAETVDNLLARLERYRQGLLAPGVTAGLSSSADRPREIAPVGGQSTGRASGTPPPPETPIILAEVVQPEIAAPGATTTQGVVPGLSSSVGQSREITPVGSQSTGRASGTPSPAVARPVSVAPKPASVLPRPAPIAPKPPAPPSKPWTEMLSGFMEQRNIRWGELIGGLLFVSSSIALVVSLWETLDKIPYFPFFLFVTVSSAVFGVGLYAHYRWKLDSTSQGMLVIATLLVPLNFVAMAGLSKDHWTWLTLIAEIVALGIFTLLVRMAAQVLVGRGGWLVAAAVIGNAAMVLIAARTIDADATAWKMLGVGGLSVAICAVSVAIYLHQLPRGPGARRGRVPIDAAEASRLFTLLGVAAFAMASAVGVMIDLSIHAARLGVLLQRMSALVTMAAVPMLAVGLTVHCGTGRKPALAAYRLAGTTLALLAMVAMVAGLGLAWPQPEWLIAAGLLDAAVLVFAAFRWRLPLLHAGAIACAALAYLTAFHWATGHVAVVDGLVSGVDMLRWTISARSGTALAGLFVVLAAVSEGLARAGYRRHGLIYMRGCAAVALAGLSLVTVHGLRQGGDDALRAAVLYGIYGAGSLGLVARWRRVELSYLGLALLAAAPLWWLLAGIPSPHPFGPLWALVLAGESLVMAVTATVLHRLFRCPWDDPVLRLSRFLAVDVEPVGRNLAILESAAKKAPCRRPLEGLYQNPLTHVAEILAALGLATAVAACWFDADSIVADPVPVATTVLLTAIFMLMAWAYRSAWRTWAGSLVALAGMVHALNFNYFNINDQMGWTWTVAPLAHATLTLLAALVIERLVSAREKDAGEALRHAIGRPLADSALFSSLLVLPALAFARSAGTTWLGICYPWLAVIWLVLAWRRRSAVLFAAHQAALAAGALVATTIWLKQVGWVVGRHALPDAPNLLERLANVSHAVLDPRNLQAYGISLGLLSIVWIAARIVDRATGGRAAHLIDSRWTVDRIVRNAVALGQFVVPLACLVPIEILRELVGGGVSPPGVLNTFGPAGWILLVTLAIMLAAALWERWDNVELLGLLALAGTLPLLAGGRFCGALAVASALRWGWAIMFAVCVTAICCRRQLAAWCQRAAMKVAVGPSAVALSHMVVLATLALPVLAVTLVAATFQLGGTVPAGPLPGTTLARLGPTWSYLAPLVLVTLGLVALAIRERSAGYAFFGGLVLEMAVVLGYSLRTKLAGDPLDIAFLVHLVQWATIAAAVWALAWLVARKRLDVWRETPGTARPRLLMNLQIGMAWLGNLVLIGLALATLIFLPLGWQTWSITAGTPLGWIALTLPLAALALRGRLRADAVGMFGMAALALLACTVGGLNVLWNLNVDPVWGYRTLMLGWATYAVVVAAAAWWAASLRTLPGAAGPPQALLRMAAVWVRAAAIPAVLLGLKAALWHAPEEKLWAAAAIALASAAGATMAVWRRREGWAFAAALGVNLAASLVVCYFEQIQQHAFETWWLRLVQANIIASAAVALVWLAARKRLYQLGARSLAESPLLALQIGLPLAANAVLLAAPVWWLVQWPAGLPQWMNELGAAAGWIALALAMIAAACYLVKAVPGNLIHVLGGSGLGVGVLTACAVARFQPPMYCGAPWLTYHILVAALAAACTILLGIGILGRPRREAAGPKIGRAGVQNWLLLLGGLSVALAVLHGFDDPLRPWWSVRAVTTIALVTVMAALWLRQAALVWLYLPLVNLAGVLLWWAWGPGVHPAAAWTPEQLSTLIETNAVCLAIGSALWLLLGMSPYGRTSWLRHTGAAHWAARSSAILPGVIVAVALWSDLGGGPHLGIQRLDWIALAAATTAAVLCLVERSASVALPLLYGLGLTALGMVLWNQDFLTAHMLCWAAVNGLAGFALLAAVASWLTARAHVATIPLFVRRQWDCPLSAPTGWFLQSQTILVALTAALAAWIAVDFSMDGLGADLVWAGLSGRMAGPPALAMLLGTAIVMAAVSAAQWRRDWQHAAFGLGVLLGAGLGCALLPADTALPWLHRSVLAIMAVALGMLVVGVGLRALLPSGSDWIARGRQALPALAGLFLVVLAAALAQEAWQFEQSGAVAVMPWAIAVVAAALASVVAGCLCCAVFPACDPWKQSDRQRQIYVYAAEGVCLLIGCHVRFTMPWLFHGFFHQYWMFLVMGLAFAGAGVSEWFRRRQLPVLSEPLERTCLLMPLLPAVGFWFLPAAVNPWTLAGQTPVVWFLVGSFYGVLAFSRRSVLCALLSLVTMNLGLWVALHQFGIEFLRHPQLWLIPAAVAALAAEYLNRRRISEAQSTALRYFAMSLIYVSSTADMYIAGVGEDWRLPLVLMVLSVAGVLLGILLRIRSFLYLGVTFLLVDIASILKYAAVDLHHTWIWCATGVALGAAIIALFAVFEKRRNDVLAAVERLKQWSR